MSLNIDFTLHGHPGQVHVRYELNGSPLGFDFDLLGIDFGPAPRPGFPVVEATVSYEPHGYSACMGWVQIVRYTVPEDGEQFLVDTAPQFRSIEGLDYPFLSWGPRPTLFDAPAIDQVDVDWWADSFLVASPDALMTPIISPLCAFRWGYTVSGDGIVETRPPEETDTAAAWGQVRNQAQKLHPAWQFTELH